MGGGSSTQNVIRAKSNFYSIGDNFKTFKELQGGLREAGLESSELIIGIDFTKSNIYNGQESFNSKSLHYMNESVNNPYQVVLRNICKSLSAFDDDNQIPCYGFGCASTRNSKVFSFRQGDLDCDGLDQVQSRYRDIALKANLAGPTSFAPLIRQAIHKVAANDFRYHVLLIIADGQVSPEDLQETKNSIVEASNFAISIVMVGVGDGPWKQMEQFDDSLPRRRFDNFQFVCLNSTIADCRKKGIQEEIGFALQALMEVPEQFQIINKLGLKNPVQAQKYYKKLKLKPVEVVDPPMGKRRMSVEASQDLISGQADGPKGGLLDFDPIYLTSSSRKAKKNLKRAQSEQAMTPVNRSSARRGSSTSAPNSPHAANMLRRNSSFSAKMLSGEMPEDFLCPITQEKMNDPVIAQDGHTYERKAIEAWFSTSSMSPMTNAQLPNGNKTLLPNFNLKSQISSWEQESVDIARAQSSDH
mmetsp:Transcript_23170/g.39216  ORF Transcript_23170/g.39216 Transcript_23170/m.39216 type:complete len:472 (-) Transcript_23170:322-1737(-)|eukprot:CAMPEP_0114435904 /NCGR_PEP_ID=MMETSP0103-20121206/13119_1 /TAXON_ID=37642 ORGANISM="Paraphysomonas imperforata, Strain PA2" /NCGR_SAMPLE_ID=MMETSP0103 /ASSEMBLY_ACC=CAM_ASM_000201 /LENGTH=471 /DNA_ID=CAMNT_0001606041 /DNA_START=201 /DNA_END=1616 /DNA_ORIENTATION=+